MNLPAHTKHYTRQKTSWIKWGAQYTTSAVFHVNCLQSAFFDWLNSCYIPPLWTGNMVGVSVSLLRQPSASLRFAFVRPVRRSPLRLSASGVLVCGRYTSRLSTSLYCQVCIVYSSFSARSLYSFVCSLSPSPSVFIDPTLRGYGLGLHISFALSSVYSRCIIDRSET